LSGEECGACEDEDADAGNECEEGSHSDTSLSVSVMAHSPVE
jgi:hypothetical protein